MGRTSGREGERCLSGIRSVGGCCWASSPVRWWRPRPASAADTVAPVVGTATFAAPPNGNNNWRITAPQTLNLSATDDVAVAKFQYSLDGGATYVDVPVTAGPSATAERAAVAGGQHDGALPRGRQLGQLLARRDHEHDLEPGVGGRRDRGPARRARPAAARATRSLIDTGAGQETATIATIVTPAPAAPAPNVTLTAPLANAHAASAAVAGTATLQHDRAADRHQGPGGDVGHAGDDAAGGGRRPAADAQRPAREPDQPRRRRHAPARSGPERGDREDRDASSPRRPPRPAPNVTLTSALTKNHLTGAARLPAADRRRQDPAVADADPAADRSAPARRRPTPSPTAPAARRRGG